jgi:hypothetical protein
MSRGLVQATPGRRIANVSGSPGGLEQGVGGELQPLHRGHRLVFVLDIDRDLRIDLLNSLDELGPKADVVTDTDGNEGPVRVD